MAELKMALQPKFRPCKWQTMNGWDEGYFHQWYDVSMVISATKTHPERVLTHLEAIVEDKKGRLHSVMPSQIVFTDRETEHERD